MKTKCASWHLGFLPILKIRLTYFTVHRKLEYSDANNLWTLEYHLQKIGSCSKIIR
jgi:hypothetical protein